MAIRNEERKNFLGDIFIGFFEDGGTNEWRRVSKYRWENLAPMERYGEIIEIGDGDISVPHTVTPWVVSIGINRLLKGEVPMNSQMLKNIREANAENDADQIDAYDADMIVQAGLFGGLRYG